MKIARVRPVPETGAPFPGLLRLVSAALLLTFSFGLTACRKPEAPAAAKQPPAAPAAAVPSESAAPGPVIRQAAEPYRPPYAGLASPRGAALDDKGRLWVIDTGNDAVRIFDSSGGFLGGWGGKGTGKHGLRDPFGIAVHGESVLIADTSGTGVEIFSQAGDWKATANAGLFGPRAVAFGLDGKAWIADTGNDRVVVCDQNLANPRSIGKKGSERDAFSSPIGIAVGPSGNVYVADAGNRRIQVLDSEGNFKATWKLNAFGPNCEPYLDVDQDESVYVTDSLQQAVLHLDRNGRELGRLTADEAGQKFARPTGIALDRKNRALYVVNSDVHSVAKLKLPGK